jgi:DNA ligase-4
MALAFNDLCLLLEEVENISIRRPRLSQEQRKSCIQDAIRKWFSIHRQLINHANANGGAILSAIFPHRRKDRVYGLKSKSLSQKLTKLLGFNHIQKALFDKWTTGKAGDLGVYTAIAMKPWDGTIKNKRKILMERVDRLLVQLAAQHRFSDPVIQKQRDFHTDTDTEIQQIFKRIDSSEAKWLVRLILREYCTIELDERFIFEQFHFLLPDLLMFQNDFDAVFSLLKGELRCYPPVPEAGLRRSMREEAGKKLSPTVGVKVGRPTFHKAWVRQSIANHMVTQLLTRFRSLSRIVSSLSAIELGQLKLNTTAVCPESIAKPYTHTNIY